MGKNQVLSLFIAFITIMIIGFFAVGFAGSVDAPTNATALAQYNNLSDATEISGIGLSSGMLLIAITMVISAMFLFASTLKRKRR